MLFERLRIENLGKVFRGEHSLNLLPTDPSRPIVPSVGALNGSGKTIFHRSIFNSPYTESVPDMAGEELAHMLNTLSHLRNRHAEPLCPHHGRDHAEACRRSAT